MNSREGGEIKMIKFVKQAIIAVSAVALVLCVQGFAFGLIGENRVRSIANSPREMGRYLGEASFNAGKYVFNKIPGKSAEAPATISEKSAEAPVTVPEKSAETPVTVPEKSAETPVTVPEKSAETPGTVPEKPAETPGTIPAPAGENNIQGNSARTQIIIS